MTATLKQETRSTEQELEGTWQNQSMFVKNKKCNTQKIVKKQVFLHIMIHTLTQWCKMAC